MSKGNGGNSMRMIVYGFQGSSDDLQRLLKHGVYVEGIKTNSKGFTVDFCEKEKSVGRPPKFTEDDFQEMYAAYMNGRSYSDISNQFKCSRTYVRRMVQEISHKKNLEITE